jgi:hypothetical protein
MVSDPDKNRLICMTHQQGTAASDLELTIPSLLKIIGPTHATFSLLDALLECDLPVEEWRYLSRMLDRHADALERRVSDADR